MSQTSSKAIELAKQAYEMLDGDISQHVQALKLLDEALKLDFESVIEFEHNVGKYKSLVITADDPATDLWLSDNEGNLVQKEIGIMDTSVLPGFYFISFGLKSEKRPITLSQDMKITQS
jgi:hypothetical protein